MSGTAAGAEWNLSPVRMAPLKSPSMDSEFANARRICGCAGIVTVKGICEIAIAAGRSNRAIASPDQHTSIVQQADSQAYVREAPREGF